jgi:hypothetical protein
MALPARRPTAGRGARVSGSSGPVRRLLLRSRLTARLTPGDLIGMRARLVTGESEFPSNANHPPATANGRDHGHGHPPIWPYRCRRVGAQRLHRPFRIDRGDLMQARTAPSRMSSSISRPRRMGRTGFGPPTILAQDTIAELWARARCEGSRWKPQRLKGVAGQPAARAPARCSLECSSSARDGAGNRWPVAASETRPVPSVPASSTAKRLHRSRRAGRVPRRRRAGEELAGC